MWPPACQSGSSTEYRHRRRSSPGRTGSAWRHSSGWNACVRDQVPRPGSGGRRWFPATAGPAASLGGVTAASGRLYLVAPTVAAARINANSTTQRAAPGIFHLRIMDMATGQVAGDLPLPAYYGDPQPIYPGSTGGVVVSVRSPPGAMAAGAGLVFVDPQLGASDVVEAFAAIVPRNRTSKQFLFLDTIN